MSFRLRSLAEALRLQAETQPNGPAVTFINDGDRDETTWTFGELDQRARAIASTLMSEGVAKGDRALILHPPGLDLVGAFFGCQYAGVVPTLTYPPNARSGSRAHDRLQRLIADAQCRILLRGSAGRSAPDAALPELVTDAVDLTAAASFRETPMSLEDTAFLQYTSGSTREPRGVIVSQRNALTNLRHLADISRARSAEVRVVMWVPPYHDLGLVGGVLMPLASGFPTHLMDPRHFMQRPLRWLEAISRHRATATGAPDSAYEACARSARGADLSALDLSSWTVGVNGAETVRAETLRSFSKTFAPSGFRPETLYPCYGLAESTLIVSGGQPGALWRDLPLGNAGAGPDEPVPRETPPGGTSPRRAVSMGHAIPEHEVLVVSETTMTPCVNGEIGEIWVRGPCVADGYWNRPEETSATFRARLAGSEEETWLRTGDLGLVVEGELLIAGRIKDLILLRGRNLFPQEIEDTVEAAHQAIEARACAAISVDNGVEESLVILAEIRRTERRRLDSSGVTNAIRRTVGREHDVAVSAVLLLPPGSLPRTTSGKIQRGEARRLFLNQGFQPLTALDSVASAAAMPAGSVAVPETIEGRLRLRAAALLRAPAGDVPLDVPLQELGLDSLMRVELLLCLDADLRASLPVEVVEGSVSLSGVAERVMRSARTVSPALAVAAGSEIPLTARQRAFLEQEGLTQPERFGIMIRLRTPAGLDIAALEAALQDLTEVHEALRLRFRRQGDTWRQILDAPRRQPLLERIDVQGAIPGQLRAQSGDWDKRLIAGIRLESGPLLQAMFLDRGPTESGILTIYFHHLVTDGLSVAILLSDLAQRYEAGSRSAPAPPSRTPGFAAWRLALSAAQSERGEVGPVASTSGDDPWRGASVEAEGREAPSPESPRAPSGLDPDMDALLIKRFPRARDVEALLLAAFAWAFARSTGRPLRAEVQTHGRWPRGGLDPWFSVGWFASLRAVELPISNHESGHDLLDAARAALRSAHETVEEPARGPRPRISAEYRTIIDAPFRADAVFPILDTVWWSPPRSADLYELDLALVSGHRHGRLWWSLGANPQAYAASTVRAMAADIKEYLERETLSGDAAS